MRQNSTRLAPPTTERPHDTPAPNLASAALQREQVTELHGVMTGLANIVNEHLGRLTIGPRATRFLRHLERMTFGNAGWHRRAGRSDPGLWSPYDHAAWAETLGLSSSALTHLRTRLITAEIIWYTPDPERRGHGALGWSFDFTSWKPPQWGGARPGAGRPSAAPSVMRRREAPLTRRANREAARRGAEAESPGAHAHGVHPRLATALNAADPMVTTSTEPTNQDVNESETKQGRRKIKTSTSDIQDVNATKSRRQRPQIKVSTAPGDEPCPPQMPGARVRRGSPKKEKKQRRKTDADASGVASTPRAPSAALGPLHSPSRHAEPQARSGPPPRAKPPPPGMDGPRAVPTGEPLPPPLPYETLRSYWLRIYREACAVTGSEARPMVHAAARALLNMGHEHADYVLLGQLRGAMGTWATVLHWILDCAARELADPRTYLRAIAARQHTGVPHRSQPGRQRGRSGRRPVLTDLTDQGADRANDMPVPAGWELPGVPQAPMGQISLDTCSLEGTVGPECSLAGSTTFTQQDQSHRVPVPDDRRERSDDSVDDDEASHEAARPHGAPDGAGDSTLASPCAPMAHLWRMVQQRLAAELTSAQFSSWLANTELYRAPDDALMLVTRTTFAAELIAQRWGARIHSMLSEITGQGVPLRVQRRRPDSVVPDG